MTSLLVTLRGPQVPEWGACTLPEALVQVRGGEGGATALGHAVQPTAAYLARLSMSCTLSMRGCFLRILISSLSKPFSVC